MFTPKHPGLHGFAFIVKYRKCFLSVHQLGELGSVVQAGAKEDLLQRERKKNHNRSLWRRKKENVRAALNKKYPCFAADVDFRSSQREEARRDIQIFLPLFIDRTLHLRTVWVDITACKLTTTCFRHWSQRIVVPMETK